MMSVTMAADIPCPVVSSGVTCYWKDMWRRLDSMRHLRELCDVSLCTDDGYMFMAHSSVLAASSDELRQKLMAAQAINYGNGCNAVHVMNISHDVLRITLDFIYGKTPTSRNDFELLQIGAARFSLPGAYEYCSRRLTEECSRLWNELDSATAQIKGPNWLESACRQISEPNQLDDSNSICSRSELLSSGSESSYALSDPCSNAQKTLNSLLSQRNESDNISIDQNCSGDGSSTLTRGMVSGVASASACPIGVSISVSETVCPFAVKKENTFSEAVGEPQVELRGSVARDEIICQELEPVRVKQPTRPVTLVPPDNFHHANLMAQMSLDDLARVDECPHLRQLTGSDYPMLSLPITEMNSGYDGDLDANDELFDGVPLKKRLRKPLLQLNTPDDDVTNKQSLGVCNNIVVSGGTSVPSAQLTNASCNATTNADASSVAKQHSATSFVQASVLPGHQLSYDNSSATVGFDSDKQKSILSNNISTGYQPLSRFSTKHNVSSNSPARYSSGSMSSSPSVFSPNSTVSAVYPSLYSTTDVKPSAAAMSFDFTPFAISRLTDSSTVPVVGHPLSRSGSDTSDRMISRCTGSMLNFLDRSPKYSHLSGGAITGTSVGFCHETSLDISNLIAHTAPSTVSSTGLPSVGTKTTTTSSSPSNCSNSNASAFISLDDVSDVLRANGFTEKTSTVSHSERESTVDSGNKENGLHASLTGANAAPSTDRVCCFCQSQCKTERQLVSHIRSAHVSADGSKLCYQCSVPFPTVADLALHLEMAHQCAIDSELAMTLARLNGNTCYIDGCTYQNPHADALQRHLHQRHSIGQPTVACPSCSRAYFSTSQLHRHSTRAHAARSVPTDVEDNNSDASSSSNIGSAGSSSAVPSRADHLTCTDCGEQFASSYKLQIHQLRAHSKGKLFSCHNCNFKSPRKKDVQAHMLSQHGTAPAGVHVYSCTVCTYKCIDKNRFEEHEAMHTGIPRYRCTMCTRVYTTRRGLRTHIKYHSTDRPHSCSTCGASFKVRSKLADHVKLVHIQKGLKPYVCGYCGHATALRGNCNQHIRKSHPNMPLVVVDRLASQRRTVKDYDYAGINGAGIEEFKDLRAAGWVESPSMSGSATS